MTLCPAALIRALGFFNTWPRKFVILRKLEAMINRGEVFMYCPQCGQQQLSENMRFCSRCGFSLRVVCELLDNGGVLMERPDKELDSRLSPRQKGVRLGALLMLTSLLIALIQAFMPTLVDKLVVLAAPVIICFLAGFVRLLYALFYEEGATRSKNVFLSNHEASSLNGRVNASLPSAKSIPVPDWHRHANTSEMEQPLSVTEGTTKLLEQDSGALSS
jgi:hypothetical protein